MLNYDLTTAAGQQAFEKYIVMLIRNEINSYVRQVLVDRSATASAEIPSGLSKNDEQDYRLARLEQAIFRG